MWRLVSSPSVARGRRGTLDTVRDVGGRRFYPFLLALHPVVFIWSQNLERSTLPSVVLTGVVVCAVVAVALRVMRALLRDRSRAGVVVATAVFVSFLYGQVANAIRERGGVVNHPLLLAASGALVLVVLVLCLRATPPFDRLTRSTNAIALILLVLAVSQTVSTGAVHLRATHSSPEAAVASAIRQRLPDIYYIVPDTYGGRRVLEREAGFDNSPFIEDLEERGFAVSDESRANFVPTRFSLMSTLGMEYPRYLLSRPAKDDAYIYDRIRDSAVARRLTAAGYRSVNIGPTWAGTGGNPYAEENVVSHLEFPRIAYASSIAWPLAERVFEVERRLRYHHLGFQFERLHAIAAENERSDRPAFVFAHLLLPHGPFLSDAAGGYVGAAAERSRGARQGYAAQVRNFNRMAIDLIDELRSKDGPEPVIIIQSDEGPQVVERRSWDDPHPDQADNLTSIFAAYHLPGHDAADIGERWSPVNTFRLIFNLYLGEDLDLLPARTYAMRDLPNSYLAHPLYGVRDAPAGPRDDPGATGR